MSANPKQKDVGMSISHTTADEHAARRWRALLAHPTLAMHLLDAAGHTLAVNAAYTALFGLTTADWQASGSVFANPGFVQSGLLPYLEQAWRGAAVTIPPRRYTPATLPTLPVAELWVRTRLMPVHDAAGKLLEVLSLHEDVSAPAVTQAVLREQEQQYRSIFESLRDALLVIDPQTHMVVSANPAAYRLLAIGPTTLLSATVEQIVDAGAVGWLAQLGQPGSERVVLRAESVPLRHGPSPRHVDIVCSPIMRAGQMFWLLLLHDVSERVRIYAELEQRVAERTRVLSTLLHTVRHIGSTLELERLLGVILEQLQLVVDYDAAAIFWLESAHELRLLNYVGPLAQERLVRRWSLDLARHSRAVIESKQPLIIPDVRASTPMAQAFQATALNQLAEVPAYIGTWMGVPLLLRDTAVGMLTFDHSQPHFYTADHADLALAFAQQAAVAIENAQLFEQANRLAVVMERQRLARELHDSVSQALYGIALGVRTAQALLERDPQRVAEPLDYVLSLADAGLAEMRALIFELRPESLLNEGLVMALAKRLEAIKVRHHLAVHAALGSEPELPLDIKETLYRVAQEALHNVVKHAHASNVWVQLGHTPTQTWLEVRDDGGGFDPQQAFPGHLGLRSMRERVQLQGGQLTLISQPGAGTLVRAELPRG